MPQQLLHPPKVKSGPDKVNSKRMSKCMRVDIEACHLSILLDNGVDLPSFDAKDRPMFPDIVL